MKTGFDRVWIFFLIFVSFAVGILLGIAIAHLKGPEFIRYQDKKTVIKVDNEYYLMVPVDKLFKEKEVKKTITP